jgi:hypothetical protein
MKKQRLETSFSRYRLQGLKPGGFGLWVSWILNLYSPTRADGAELVASCPPGSRHGIAEDRGERVEGHGGFLGGRGGGDQSHARSLGVAVQVAFESNP